MVKKWITFGLLVGLIGAAVTLAGGCAQTTETATTTTTSSTTTSSLSSASAVIIEGTTATSSSGLSLKALSRLASADVFVYIPSRESFEGTEAARGTTTADGTYSINVPRTAFDSVRSDNGLVANVFVVVSREGTVLGCVIPSISPEAGRRNYAPTANPGDYVKQRIARKAFKKGIDPKTFDYNSNIEQKMSSETMKDYNDPTKIDYLADSIKSGADAESKIATALGISATILGQMQQKGMELHRQYLEPIFQQALADNTPPNRAQLDVAMSSLEAAMLDFAKGLGLTEQQFADLKSMKDKTTETKLSENFSASDEAFKETKRRMCGSKIINLFLGQWGAGDVLANTKTTGIPTSFADAYPLVYQRFVSSREVIIAQLNNYLNDATISDTMVIGSYLRNQFSDAYIFPPPSSLATIDAISKKASGEAMNQMMNNWKGTRIMIYFMHTFLTEQERITFFSSMETSMKKVYEDRFQNESSDHYLGPKFWSGNPTATQIQDRLDKFNTALTNVVDNNVVIKNMFESIFGASKTAAILKAFRILMAEPDMF